jgi:secondary thiamine-phosphate synthase enzyme
MTSIEVPYSIAAALPTLSVMDITNDVSRSVGKSGRKEGIAYIHTTHGLSLVRVQERETGFFEDLESLLERVVPSDSPSKERLVAALLGPRSEQVPFADGALCLGQWQRILLFSLDAEHRNDWSLTVLG